MEKLKIFISGTQDDLKPERDAVDRAVNSTTLSTGIRAETAVSQPQSPRAWIEQQIRECNIYIGVYSHRYGWVVPGENVSATEFEFNLARKLGKPALVWIRSLHDEEKAKPDFDRQEQFLNRVSDFSTGHLRQEFDDPEDLEKWVTTALSETFTEIIRRGTAPSSSKFLVPFPHNPDFVGRDTELTSLHELLQHGGSIVGIRPTVLVGLGGIGKTQLAVEYAHAYRDDYPNGIFWLNAVEPLFLEFARLAEKLELADTSTPRDRAAQRAWEYLNQHTHALVIFDNVLEPSDLNVPFANDLIPANLRCRTLFTTRKHDFPRSFQPFEVKILPEGAAMHLLLRHPSRQAVLEVDHPEHGLARVVCITLGYLPLALELAAAFLGDYPKISLYDYRVRLLDEGAINVVDETDIRPDEMPTRHETAIRATLKTSWDALIDEEARVALLTAGQLREAELIPIPRLGLLAGLESPSKQGHPSLLDRALKKLYTASLIEELTADQLRLHPLVHAFAAELAPPNLRFQMAARVAAALYDPANLETTVIQRGPDEALEDLRIGLDLGMHDTEDDQVFTRLSSLERVLDKEMYRLHHWNPEQEPGFFLQQFRNRSLELGYSDLKSRADALLLEHKLSHLRERFPVSRESAAVIRTLEGHEYPATCVVVTADGRRAISGSVDKTLKVWDLKTGQVIRTLEGHTAKVNSVSVTADGRWAISASDDKTIKVWDLKTGQAIRSLGYYMEEINSVAISPDGHWAVSAYGGDFDPGTDLLVWDLKKGEAIRTLQGHKKVVNSVAVSPDWHWVVSASDDKTLKLWDLTMKHSLWVKAIRSLEGHTSHVTAVAVTSDGHWAVSASDDKTLKVWDLKTRRSAIRKTIRKLLDKIDRAAGVVASPAIPDLKTGKAILTLNGHTSKVTTVAVTPDRRLAVSGSVDNTVKVWNLKTGQAIRTLKGHTDFVSAVAVTPDGHQAVSASWDNTIKFWDLTKRQASWNWVTMVRSYLQQKFSINTNLFFPQPLKGHEESVRCVTVTANGRWAISVSDKDLRLWDLQRGNAIHEFKGHRGEVNGVAVTADGRWAVSASADETLKVWDLEKRKAVRALKGHTDPVNDVAIMADGRRAVSASADGTLKVWDLKTGEAIRTLEGQSHAVTRVAVTADGRWAISAFGANTLKIWDLQTGKAIHAMEDNNSAQIVAVTPDGRWAIWGSNYDRTLKVWDFNTQKVVHTLKGHTDDLTGVAVTADGRWAISASEDKTLKVWNLTTAQAVLTVTANAAFMCCAITADNQRIVAGDKAGGVHFIEWMKY